jgi:hypothetical protein
MTNNELPNKSSDTGTKVPMTHELLAKIDANGTNYDGNTGITTEVVTRPHRNDKALRAVVELHRNVDGACWECQDSIYHEFPCPTIRAIEKELR